MLSIFPFIYWLPAIASAILLFFCWSTEEVSRRTLVIAGISWLVAAWLQFRGGSPVASATGLALQTILAIALSIRR